MSDLFVGVLGHDLRNPLSSITAGAALIEQDPDDVAGTLRKIRIIQRAAGRMDRLIQQVLDFALARVKGGIPVAPVESDMAAIARQAAAELDGGAASDRVVLEVVGRTTGQWDTDRMLQVVSNLVANALEHGEPKTAVRVLLDGIGADVVRLEVRNGGVIPPATLAQLFSPYKPRERNARGLGLGLFIVDQIVRSHRGEVTVISEEGVGTTFVIKLPRG